MAGRVLLIPANGGSGLPKVGDGRLVERVRSAHAKGAIIASACAGAAWVVAAGIDQGRTITTHWNLAAALTAMRPGLRVLSSEILIDHGDLVTAGGLLSWVDLGLHIAERFWGSSLADELARVLVWDRDRKSQLPFSPPGGAWSPLRPDPSLERAIAWARARFRAPMSVAEWAGAAAMSLRTMERRWSAAFGETPLGWLQAVRVEEARLRLEETSESWEEITPRCGYEDPASFREVFERRMGWTPGRYRRSRRRP
jgi:transcriptional regulator GlxA family with amidase domain